MKALILAAGYGTRLYALTKNRAKPLLYVGQRPIIDYILDRLEKIEDIKEIYVVTNQKFIRQFEEWKELREKQHKDIDSKKIKIINDGTFSNIRRLGAIRDIELVIREEA